MAALDGLALVHLGRLRTGPPATGAEPQRDTHLRAHIGRLVLLDGTEPIDDETFCILATDDEDFRIRATDDETFCVVVEDDEDFSIRETDDEVFCVVIEDDDEVKIK